MSAEQPQLGRSGTRRTDCTRLMSSRRLTSLSLQLPPPAQCSRHYSQDHRRNVRILEIEQAPDVGRVHMVAADWKAGQMGTKRYGPANRRLRACVRKIWDLFIGDMLTGSSQRHEGSWFWWCRARRRHLPRLGYSQDTAGHSGRKLFMQPFIELAMPWRRHQTEELILLT